METYLFQTIQTEEKTRKELFREMIRRLEDSGKCHENFHLLELYFTGQGHWLQDMIGRIRE